MIGTTFQFAWEVKLIAWLQTYLPSLAIFILDKVFYLGDTVFIVIVLSYLYLCYDKKAGKIILTNAILSLMTVGLVKNVFERRRPYFDNPEIKCLRVVEKEYDMYDIRKQGFSFPSMHTSNIASITSSFYRYYKKKFLLIIAIVLTSIVGVSRFVFGCHYPTDVLAGLAIGLISTYLFTYMQEKMNKKLFNLFGLLLITIGCSYCTSTDFYSASGLFIGLIVSSMIDEKYINFENTKNIKRAIVRLIISLVIFLAVKEGIKLPFNAEMLDSDTMIAYIIRMARYAIATIVAYGLIPFYYKKNIFKFKD